MKSKLYFLIDFLSNLEIGYYILIIFILILIIISIKIAIYYRNVKIVKNYSIKYKSLIELNEKTHFNKM